MLFSTVISLLLLLPLGLQLKLEAARTSVMQLDRTNVTFCQLDKCGILSSFQDLEPLSPAIVIDGKFGATVTIDVINHQRLVGKREIWALLRTPEGKIIEGMKIWLELKNAGRNQLEFFFTGTKAEFDSAVLFLGF